jgi:O-antigen/teichoic acid export membrane protein
MLAPLSWWHSRGGRIAAAVSSGVATRGLSALATLLTLPLAVRYLGAERFGVWATTTSTVVFLNLLDFGIASTLTNQVARAYAVGDREYASRYATNALVLTAAVACLAGGALLMTWSHVNWMRLFNVSHGVPPAEVSATVAVAIALVLLGLPASLCHKILAGYQEVHVGNVAVAAGTLASLAGLLAGIALRVSMPVLFVMSSGGVTVANLAALVGLLFWRKPWLRPKLLQVNWRVARELLGSGVGFFLIQIAGAVVFSSDNVVVSHYLGAAQVTPYSVTWRLVGLSAVAQGLVFPALWPAYAEAYAKGEYKWMRSAFRATLRISLVLNLGFAVLLVGVGKPLIRWWAGAAAVPTSALLLAMAVWAVISGCMTVESCLLAAVSRTREQGILSLIAATLNLGLSILLVKRIGVVGVISGTILSYLFVLVVPQSLIVRTVLRENVSATQQKSGNIPATSALRV